MSVSPGSQTGNIQKAAVIGAGAMGSGIAAQLANAGVEVYLLDIVPKNATDRNVIATTAIQRMLKAAPATDPLNAGFMDAANAQRITPGNIEDHLALAVQDADWIVEVVIENLDVKRNLYAQLETLTKPDAIISSNTSTIPLRDLTEGRSDSFKQRFLITHFFNPPRFMHLLEIVAG
ncbi:MAG: 3-hydroxyacyl-CoA dehydrogenase, partial [Vampirovibrio sp.]|nr:3-hydroxyacyl-CoA dehydrogenase [Vampirovibrio sp.]